MPSTDPFAALVSRALGVSVDAVETERVDDWGEVGRAETERVRWRGSTGRGSLLLRRLPSAAAVEPGLLPYLSRRGAPAPRLLATGLPPRHAPESRAWVMVEEPPTAAVASPSDARRAGEALRAVHALAADRATLEALRVPVLDPARLRDEARWAEELLPAERFARVEDLARDLDPSSYGDVVLAHGALELPRVRIGDGIVFVAWSRAYLGPRLADLARLADRLGANAAPFLAGYGGAADLAAGRVLDRLLEIRWRAWEAREMLRSRAESASLIEAALG